MLGRLIVIIVVLFLVALSAYLIHDSLAQREKEGRASGLRKWIKDARNNLSVKNTNAPVICVKLHGDMNYKQYPMNKKEMRIGRSSGCDIVLEDETVEGNHAVVRKVIRDNKVYYELVNLARLNPAQYFNRKKSDYDYMGYKKGVVLGTDEVFYFGETKIIIKCPVQGHELTRTERMLIGGKQRQSEEAVLDERYSPQEPTPDYSGKLEIDI